METSSAINQENLTRLRYRWGLIAILSYLLLCSTVIILIQTSNLYLGFRWFLGAAIIWGYVLRTLWRFLEVNKHPDNPHLHIVFGIGTQVTLFRGFLLAALGGCILLPQLTVLGGWIPALLYLIAALSDGVDGYLARKYNHVTILGEQIDMRLDALGILLASALGVHYGQLQPWYLLVGFSYYLFTLGQHLQKLSGRQVWALLPRRSRSVLAGLQMGFLSVILWPIFSPPATTLAAYIFGIPLLVTFVRDYLIMTGRLSIRASGYPQWEQTLNNVGRTFLLPVVRLMLPLTIVIAIITDRNLTEQFTRIVADSQFPGFFLTAEITPIISVILLVCVLSGILPRISALLFAGMLAAFLTISITPNSTGAVLFLLSLVPVIFGGGRLCLFPWEERILYRTNIRK